MDQIDVGVLTNKDIPESIRAKIAEHQLGAGERDAQRQLDALKLHAENRRFYWSTPVVAALAGLITLTATFVFDRMTASEETANTITLEQVRKELEESEVRLTQELELNTSVALARLEAEAKEREFQFEIVRSELDKEGKTNAERAAVLLFLARAGVLNALDANELRAMAEEQKQNPDQEIIPQLSSSTSPESFPAVVEQFFPVNAAPLETAAFERTYQLVDTGPTPEMFCNAYRLTKTRFLAMSHCLGSADNPRDLTSFELRKYGMILPIATSRSIEPMLLPMQATGMEFLDSRTPGHDGLTVITAQSTDPQANDAPVPLPAIRAPVVGETLFLFGYAPPRIGLSLSPRGLIITGLRRPSLPVVHRGCKVLSVEAGRVLTDCISSQGMSGAPIFAASDGALISLAAWGEDRIGVTDGPALYLYAADIKGER